MAAVDELQKLLDALDAELARPQVNTAAVNAILRQIEAAKKEAAPRFAPVQRIKEGALRSVERLGGLFQESAEQRDQRFGAIINDDPVNRTVARVSRAAGIRADAIQEEHPSRPITGLNRESVGGFVDALFEEAVPIAAGVVGARRLLPEAATRVTGKTLGRRVGQRAVRGAGEGALTELAAGRPENVRQGALFGAIADPVISTAGEGVSTGVRRAVDSVTNLDDEVAAGLREGAQEATRDAGEQLKAGQRAFTRDRANDIVDAVNDHLSGVRQRGREFIENEPGLIRRQQEAEAAAELARQLELEAAGRAEIDAALAAPQRAAEIRTADPVEESVRRIQRAAGIEEPTPPVRPRAAPEAQPEAPQGILDAEGNPARVVDEPTELEAGLTFPERGAVVSGRSVLDPDAPAARPLDPRAGRVQDLLNDVPEVEPPTPARLQGELPPRARRPVVAEQIDNAVDQPLGRRQASRDVRSNRKIENLAETYRSLDDDALLERFRQFNRGAIESEFSRGSKAVGRRVQAEDRLLAVREVMDERGLTPPKEVFRNADFDDVMLRNQDVVQARHEMKENVLVAEIRTTRDEWLRDQGNPALNERMQILFEEAERRGSERLLNELAGVDSGLPSTPELLDNARQELLFSLGIDAAKRGDELAQLQSIGAIDPSLPPHSRRISERMRHSFGSADRPTFWQRVRDLYKDVVSTSFGIKEAERALAGGRGVVDNASSPYVAARMAQGSARRAEGWLEIGPARVTANGVERIPDVMSYAEIHRSVAGRIAELNRYEVARRAVDLHARGIETGINLDDALKEVAGADDAIRRAHLEKVKYRRALLDYWREAGGLSQGAYDAMVALGDHYVPFFRILKGKAKSPSGGGPGKIGQQVRRIRGSEREILNPVLADIDMTQRIIRAADNQRVVTQLTELAELNPEYAVGLLERASTSTVPDRFTRQAKRLQEAAAEAGRVIDDDTAEEIASALADSALRESSGTITVFRDGELQRWKVDPDLKRSLDALGPAHVPLWLRLLASPVGVFKGGITLEPGFGVNNAIADSFSATMQSRHGFRLGIDSFNGFMESIRANWLGTPSKLYEDFVLSGGGFASLRGKDNASVRQLAQRLGVEPGLNAERVARGTLGTLLHPLEALKKFAKPFEEAARIGEFARAGQRGADGFERAMAQADVSVNFLERGRHPAIRGLNMTVPFGNPAIQSADAFLKALGRNAQNPKFYAIGMLTIAMPSALFWAAARDDQEIIDRQKSSAGLIYWFFRAPDGSIGRLRKPFVWGQVFGTGMEAALDGLLEEDPEAMSRWVQGVRDQTISTSLPWVFERYVEQKANEDSFFKTPIVPRDRLDVIPPDQYANYTSELAKRFGETIYPAVQGRGPVLEGLASPARIEKLFGDITGTLGRRALRFVDETILEMQGREASPPAVERADVMLIGRFFGREATTAVEPVQTFYDTYDELQKIRNTFVKRRAAGQVEKTREFGEAHQVELAAFTFYEAAAKEMAEIRSAMRGLEEIPDREMSRAEKLETKKELSRQIVELARRVNQEAAGNR